MQRFPIGKVILKRYRIEEFIASGGTKEIYKVFDQHMGVPLAMKVPRADLDNDKDILEIFKGEAKALSGLDHPNIVQFFGVQRLGDSFAMFESFVDGLTLKDVLDERKPLSLFEALIYFKALCRALGYAHVKNLIHCDVKPGNVLTDQGGNVLLTDFGIVRHSDSDDTSILKGAGTTPYMAPEQVLAKKVTKETDIYALGVTLFQMVTGRTLFTGNEPELETHGTTKKQRIEYAIQKIAPPGPRKFNKKISEGVSAAILKSLEKDPVDRYHSTQEFLAAVCSAAGIEEDSIPDRVNGNNPLPPPPPPPPPRLFTLFKKFVYVAWATIQTQKPYFMAGIAGIILLTLYFLWPPIPPKPPSQPPFSAITVEPSNPLRIISTPTITLTPSITPTATITPTPTVTSIPSPAISWLTGEIDSQGSKDFVHTRLVANHKGSQFAIYLNDKNDSDQLKMATYNGSRWFPEPIGRDPAANDGFYPSLAFDKQGKMQITYYAYKKHQIMYGSRPVGGYWTIFPIERVNDRVLGMSMVIDKNDILHIIYYDSSSNKLRYIQKTNGIRATVPSTMVVPADAEGKYFPVAIDSQNQLHLVYRGTSGGLWHITSKGNLWSTPEPIDSSKGAGYYPSIVIDEQSRLHVSYFDSVSEDLKYAIKENGKWINITVDSEGNVGQYTSIAIDSKEHVHISYYDVDHQNLKYAVNHEDPEAPNAWYRYIVDTNGNVGTWNSLLLDQDGNPWVSYNDHSREMLKYAYADIQKILR